MPDPAQAEKPFLAKMKGCNTKINALLKQVEMHVHKVELMPQKAKVHMDEASCKEREDLIKRARGLVDDGRSAITIQTLITLLRTANVRTVGSQQQLWLRDVLKTYEDPECTLAAMPHLLQEADTILGTSVAKKFIAKREEEAVGAATSLATGSAVAPMSVDAGISISQPSANEAPLQPVAPMTMTVDAGISSQPSATEAPSKPKSKAKEKATGKRKPSAKQSGGGQPPAKSGRGSGASGRGSRGRGRGFVAAVALLEAAVAVEEPVGVQAAPVASGVDSGDSGSDED
jgi:hypothetical protein